MTMQKQKRDRTLDCLTYSPQRKHWRFSLLLRFRLHSSRSGRFCKNQLPSSKVAADFNVASLGVCVIPMHASLSACNRNTEVFPTLQRSPFGSIYCQGFHCTTFFQVSWSSIRAWFFMDCTFVYFRNSSATWRSELSCSEHHKYLPHFHHIWIFHWTSIIWNCNVQTPLWLFSHKPARHGVL